MPLLLLLAVGNFRCRNRKSFVSNCVPCFVLFLASARTFGRHVTADAQPRFRISWPLKWPLRGFPRPVYRGRAAPVKRGMNEIAIIGSRGTRGFARTEHHASPMACLAGGFFLVSKDWELITKLVTRGQPRSKALSSPGPGYERAW